MSLSSNLTLLEPLDPALWRNIQGFRMNRHGPDRELCDPEVLDHIIGSICRAINDKIDPTAETTGSTWGCQIAIERDGFWIKVWKDSLKWSQGWYESIPEGLLAGYVACLQELA